ncbi:helix-turn-helix domain-containing protein [Bacteroides thetaiotaomicron]|uniref:helix-turn-helix domain-containing protein n=2 Tax=Bacteroides thetaiotaomicron TaxID=818 RepID=UPI001F3CA07E|nr:helix-turn-helix domain-containing protein [Bacteroides thetaiotaomicron]
MLPLPLEMDGARPLEANFTADNSKTRYIMEIVIIEREAFETFMAEVSALTEKVDRLCARGTERRLKKWMDGEDVCRLLRLSPKTLQSMRDRGIVACSQVGRKFYYRSEDVERFVSEKWEGAS